MRLGIMTSVSVWGKHLLPCSAGWFCLGRPRGLAPSKVYLLGQALAGSKEVTYLGKMGRNEHQPWVPQVYAGPGGCGAASLQRKPHPRKDP